MNAFTYCLQLFESFNVSFLLKIKQTEIIFEILIYYY